MLSHLPGNKGLNQGQKHEAVGCGEHDRGRLSHTSGSLHMASLVNAEQEPCTYDYATTIGGRGQRNPVGLGSKKPWFHGHSSR